MENKFFIDNNKDYTKEQLTKIKANNYFIIRALSVLHTSIRDNNPIIGGPFRPVLIKGKPQYADSLTGMDTNDLAGKLKFLTLALNDKDHPENIEIFKNSFLNKSVLKPLLLGNYYDSDNLNFWSDYKNVSTNSKIKNLTVIDYSYYLQKNDLNTPIGLDFSKIIDTLVKTDKNGNYYLENSYSIEDEVEITEAVNLQLHSFQDHPKLKDNFEHLENEDEYEFD